MCDKNSLADFFADADSRTCVIHCAGIVSVASRPSQKLYQVNVGGTWRILRQCLAHEAGRLIHVSSVHAIPEKPEGCVITESCGFSPGLVDGDYAKSKAAATELVFDAAERGLNASIVFPVRHHRARRHTGGSFTSMAKSFLAGKLPLTVRGGYDFVDVRDVAKGILTCSESGEPGKGCILSGHYITIRKMLQFVGKAAKLKYRPICLPLSLAKLAAPYYERRSLKKRKPLFFTPYFVAVLASNGQFSHAAASECFAYQPRPMEKTLWDTETCRIGQRRKGETVLGTIEGFYVREVDAPDAGWTYSDEVYYARFSIDASDGNNVRTLTLYPAHKTDNGYIWDRNNPVDRMIFTNSYTENLRTVEVPFTKTVKLGGNASPGRTTEIFDIGNGNENDYKDVTYTAAVTTKGVGSYDGKLIISGPEKQVQQFISEGISVCEVDGGASGWTYSTTKWYIDFTPREDQDGKPLPFAIHPYDVQGAPVDKMTFENIYTHNRTTPAQRPTEKPNTPETTISSPKTFDAGVALYGVSALLSLTGTALLIKRKNG